MTNYQLAKRYRLFMGQLEPDENGDYMLVSEYQLSTKSVYDALQMVQETSIAHAGKQNAHIADLEAELRTWRICYNQDPDMPFNGRAVGGK